MNPLLFILPVSLFCLCSCGHIFTKNHTYMQSAPVRVNGALVSSAVKPNGGKSSGSLSAMIYMAAYATLDGPFKWRIQAEGRKGVHTSMVVNRLKVTTSKTNRSEWYPTKNLGYKTNFVPYKKEPGKVFAVFQIPGELKVYPRKDGDIALLADVTISTIKRREKKLITFDLKAHSKRDVEFFNLPQEIIKGYNKDPREWKSQSATR